MMMAVRQLKKNTENTYCDREVASSDPLSGVDNIGIMHNENSNIELM